MKRIALPHTLQQSEEIVTGNGTFNEVGDLTIFVEDSHRGIDIDLKQSSRFVRRISIMILEVLAADGVPIEKFPKCWC